MTESERTGVQPYMCEPESDTDEGGTPAEQMPMRMNQDIS